VSAKAIFVGGTSSHAGKSWMATAICRHLHRRGFAVAPFKAQNMSNNSYPCRVGGEIGRAQVVQAQACGLEPEPDMNPVLLKPSTEIGSQVVLHGKVWQNIEAREYYRYSDFLMEQALAAYRRLATRFEYVVIEGAGSIAEVNLKDRDIANLRFARVVGAPALVVADVDRGGVFASVLGTLLVLDPQERSSIRSFAINRFRGDPELFREGVLYLERRAELPCLGVFPYLAGLSIDEEDSVSLDDVTETAEQTTKVAIIRLPHISNFTDLRLLKGAAWISRPVSRRFRAVILPGTKSTISDLEWLKRTGLAQWVCDQYRDGALVVGICGGYQMLGRVVKDPYRVESRRSSAEGLGLLPVETTLCREKITRVVEAHTSTGLRFSAYEIHMGVTTGADGQAPFATFSDGTPEGIRAGRCIGTYLHGALENGAVVEETLGIAVSEPCPKEESYDRLAEWFETHANLSVFEENFL